MNKLSIFTYFITFILLCFIFSCKKYLDEKPDSRLYTPETMEDLQALLDMNSIMNFSPGSSLNEIIAGDIYVKEQRWDAVSPDLRGAYIWEDKAQQVNDGWVYSYNNVYVSNVVLDNLPKTKIKEPKSSFENIEGSALFYRSFAFYYLLQLYSKPYSETTSNEDLGIIIKLNPSISDQIKRSSVKDGYDQIINDLLKSIALLPITSSNIMRPNKAAAKALLARVYLSMSDYDNAALFAEQVLKEYPTLLDYNILVPSSNPLLPDFFTNPEIIFFRTLSSTSLTSAAAAIIDSTLYKSYDENDLRKKVFFTTSSAGGSGTYRFKGSYYNYGNTSVFNGLTVDEIYLTISECLARKGKVSEAIDFLNQLLRKRYVTGSFTDYEISDQMEAINTILLERRKELIFRGIRWTDIRRLNLEGKEIEIKRLLKGVTYTLSPNDIRSVLLIPEIETSRSGIQQNPR